MFPTINPTSTKAWKKLLAHAETMKTSHLSQLFQEDPDRSKKYSLCQALVDVGFIVGNICRINYS